MTTSSTGMQFTFSIPTNIVFGLGALDAIGTHVKILGFKRPLIVTDKIVSQGDGMKKILAKLSEAGAEAVVWDEIAAEPVDTTLTEGVKRFRADRCDGLIGFGGGSPMDTAKGVGVLAVSGDDDPTPYQRGGTKTVPGCVPVIAIPTTAGTGSEVTSVCVFTSQRTGHKLPIRHPSLLPKVTVVDPRLMLSMPPKVTMATGIDALSHASECFTQVREHPFADTLSLQAIKLIVENLPKAVKNGRDEEARSTMALAAVMAGTAFEVGGLQFHAYAQALGAKYHAPHGGEGRGRGDHIHIRDGHPHGHAGDARHARGHTDAAQGDPGDHRRADPARGGRGGMGGDLSIGSPSCAPWPGDP
jgi:alcohol dehydrogenase